MELARAGTSRPILSTYEHDRKTPTVYEHDPKTPTVATLERLLAQAGYEFAAIPTAEAVQHVTSRGRPFWTLTRLRRLPVDQALRTMKLPGRRIC